MYTKYFWANQGWGVVFGDSVIAIGETGKRFFSSLEELEDALQLCGLKVVISRKHPFCPRIVVA